MIVSFTDQFRKQYKKANVRIRNRFDIVLKKFINNPMDHELRNHPLHEKLEGFRSVDVTSDWRAIYKEENQDEIVFYFVALGTHSQLYK
ncbi:type II toxin-antitoxin system YafQ family toxin [Patescibacteria group bacterium]|nr:type II toxin-antitoxin system YafQ family toxin [Patescibacteria group bacterium]